jgi:hypothetical protein
MGYGDKHVSMGHDNMHYNYSYIRRPGASLFDTYMITLKLLSGAPSCIISDIPDT